MFPLSFQWVPIRFPIHSPSSQCVLQHVLHSTSRLSHMLWQMLPSFHLYRWAKGGGGTLYIKREPSILGSLHSFIFFWVMGQSNWLAEKKEKKKRVIGTWEAPHLINRERWIGERSIWITLGISTPS
jgi:hypothetical protein